MNFKERTNLIISGNEDAISKSIAIANLLVPKIMYVPFSEVPCVQQALQQFQSSLLKNGEAYYLLEVLFNLFEYKRSNYKIAIKNIQELNKTIQDADKQLKASAHTVMAVSHRSLGDQEQALNHFQQAIAYFDTYPKEAYRLYFKGLTIYHTAEIYGELKDYQEMLNKHLMFTEYAQVAENPDFLNRAYNGVGRAYQQLGDFKNAIQYLKLGNESAKKAGNIPFKARNLHDVGHVYFLMTDYDNSLKYYQNALDLRNDYGLTNATVTTLMGMSEVKRAQQEYAQSIEILQEALAIALPLKVNKKIYQIYQCLSDSYEQSGDLNKALSYYKKFHALKVELDNVEKTKVENQRIREKNTLLQQQKEVIEAQKQQIESTFNQLQVNAKYLENFAAVAAHDLKAPIRIAVNFTQLLKRRFKNVLDDDAQEFIHYITHNVSKLSKMIDDLLLLSKLGQHLPPPEEVNLNQIIIEVEERLSEKIEQSNTQITVLNDLPTIKAHDTLISQLIQNLLDNSIKHRHSDKIPQIQILSVATQDPSFCEIQILDNGQGIAEELQPYIFDLFNHSRRTDNTGIGLATCKKIVNHYGGKIHVSSEIDTGTTFHFTLPLEV